MLVDDKWIRIMADFSAEGVWEKDGSATTVDDLPVSAALKLRILRWQKTYEDDCQDYLPPHMRTRNLDVGNFAKEGREIAQAVKRELPDWTVVYFDEEMAEADNRDDGDRSAFEYEMVL